MSGYCNLVLDNGKRFFYEELWVHRINSIEQYYNTVTVVGEKYKKVFSNVFIKDNLLNRYIKYGRLYYEDITGGILIITDEENYYRLFLLVGSGEKIFIPQYDKPVAIRNIYKNRKNTRLLAIENMLRENGFVIDSSAMEILARPCFIEDLEKKCDRALRFTKRFGIDLIYADRSMYHEMMELKERESAIKYYQLRYEDPNEIFKDIDAGYYRCAVSEDGTLCAMQHFIPDEETIMGDLIVVREDLKLYYGIGAAMGYQSLLYAKERGINTYLGWVAQYNTNSINYHEALGYSVTDKRADEWIRNKGDQI